MKNEEKNKFMWTVVKKKNKEHHSQKKKLFGYGSEQK